jgi:electron transfer flavoprotein-quinone oxidoreductase
MEKVDCIVVGGGLAGLAAAYGLAAEGLEVMVLERGNYSGAKNVTGGRLYMEPIRALYPELWAEAPFERAVARESITLMGDGAHTTIEVASDRFTGAQPQSYTVLRARFDQWLADKATEKGAMIVPNTKADELLREKGSDGRPGRVIGIRAGGDEIGADVTIVAEGVLGMLASAAGLRPEPAARDSALGFKEVIELPASVIEDRWRLNEGEGAAHLFMGTVTRGMLGGGFVYTNKESISVGLVVGMKAMLDQAEPVEAYKLLDEFKELPQIAPLVKGGTVAEYSAHAIAEGGIAKVPQLFGDGYLLAGDAAGLSLNALVTVRGMDFAIASGYHAARAVVAAKKAGDTSAAGLAGYERALRDSFVLKDLETSRAIPRIVENPRLFTHYPRAVSKLAESVFTIGAQPSPRLAKTVWKGAHRDFLSLATLKDLWSLRKM